MNELRKGRQSIVFPNYPSIAASAAVAGKKEGKGPLRADFDQIAADTKLGQASWEKAESMLQKTAFELALEKASLACGDLDILFAGDLLNQCISSSFAARDTNLPFLGLYGACSTMAESLLLAASFVNAGYAKRAAALTSSHFASAERQYRFPLGYGGQRTPTAQWTVTASGCCIVSTGGKGPFIEGATIALFFNQINHSHRKYSFARCDLPRRIMPRRVLRPQAQKNLKSFFAATCAWRKILLSLQT